MNTSCSPYATLEFVGTKWTLLILLDLYKGKSSWKRYSEIKRGLPAITPKILSGRLKEMEAMGMLERHVDASQFPVKTGYRLTPAGRDFIKIIKQIKKWSLLWKTKNKVCEKTDCKNCSL